MKNIAKFGLTMLFLLLVGVLSVGVGQTAVSAGTNHLLYLPLTLKQNDDPVPFGPVHSGEGTYYFATGAGNCSFDPSPQNLMVAALNSVDYAGSALCGAFIEVTGPQGSVVVRIVDQCPGCAEGDVDLSQEAYAEIAELAAGRVDISWQLVSPVLDGPIVYHFKDGSNQWWTAVQIRNHRNPIAKVEYWNGSSYVDVPRLSYNYFVETSGMGPGPYTFRVTDTLGNVLMDTDIPHVEDGDVSGGGQFPAP
ncbi:MAG: hypothetical protein DHS20C20_13530 [Ardenticatenaceae bacterium]|nr:MAG: hypothetical protein DHS20C20_13530 [Ardenticatenaceae bacterium]